MDHLTIEPSQQVNKSLVLSPLSVAADLTLSVRMLWGLQHGKAAALQRQRRLMQLTSKVTASWLLPCARIHFPSCYIAYMSGGLVLPSSQQAPTVHHKLFPTPLKPLPAR